MCYMEIQLIMQGNKRVVQQGFAGPSRSPDTGSANKRRESGRKKEGKEGRGKGRGGDREEEGNPWHLPKRVRNLHPHENLHKDI